MADRRLTRRQLVGSMTAALLGGLAGCSGLPGDPGQSTPTSSTATAPSTPSPPSTSTITTTAETTTVTTTTTSTTEPTTTPTEQWTQPEPPRQPTENKRDNRISGIDVINTKKAANGEGYTDFDIRVGANTWMKDVDPEPEEDGDPYFIVEINGTLVARTDTVPFRKEGSFTIPIKRAALQQFDTRMLNVRVSLFDKDHSRADLYGVWTGTIEYQPSTEST